MNNQLRDVYGNPIRQTDEYGNPVQQSGTMGSYDTGAARHGSQDVRHDPLTRTDYGVAGVGTQTTTTGHQHAAGYDTGNPTRTGYQGGSYDSGLQHRRPHETGPAMVHLTGTHSDSSSSEDDELGGRRKKKGLREKMKEKLPGGKPQTAEYGATTTPGLDPHTHHEEHEKKGIMEKIKEKLPGSH